MNPAPSEVTGQIAVSKMKFGLLKKTINEIKNRIKQLTSKLSFESFIINRRICLYQYTCPEKDFHNMV